MARKQVYFGWDIGGAHLKVARLDGDGQVVAVRQIACPLWRGINELSRACHLLDFNLDDPDAVHAVTMTGELCDIFPDRSAGVRAIIAGLLDELASGAEVRVFAGYEGWLEPAAASGAAARAVASANWLALAAYTAELIGDGMLIDIGSTTTDVIPIFDGEVRAQGRDDATRMALCELVYTGVVRTPVSSVTNSVAFRGQAHALAAETFATMADVYRLLDAIGDRDDLMPTADGQGKDHSSSARRLARMLGRDLDDDDSAEMCAVAANIASAQRRRIEDAIALVLSRAPQQAHGGLLVGAGVGRFVVEAIALARGAAYRGFGELVGAPGELRDAVSIAAPAVAAAKLAWMTV